MKFLKVLLYIHPILILGAFLAICDSHTEQALDQCISEYEKVEVALNMRPNEPKLTKEKQNELMKYFCPKDMTVVLGGKLQLPAEKDRPATTMEITAFCMDIYEFPNKKFQVPLTGLTFLESENRCREIGKRLCTEDEWLFACAGPENRPYSYSHGFQPWRCNAEGTKQGACDQIVPSGSHPGCHNEYGIYDLNGNVSEWVTSRKGMQDQYAVMGGTAWPSDYGQSCFSRHTHPLEESNFCDDGFRCCTEAK